MVQYRDIMQWKANRKLYASSNGTINNDLNGYFCFLKPFYLSYPWKGSMYYLCYVCTWIGKNLWLIISIVFLKLKDFWRSQAVTYTVSVVISQKPCKI